MTDVAALTPEAFAALQEQNRILSESLAKANGRVNEIVVERDTYKSQATTVATERDTFRNQASSLVTERDNFKSQLEQLKPKAEKVDTLEVAVQNLTNEKREAAIVEALRTKLPGAEPLTIRGTLQQLHEQKKINRFAEDPAAEAAKALPIITVEAPSLTRPPTGIGGNSLVRQGGEQRAGYQGPFSKKS